jgi:lysophospholipase L1-like esterase
MLLVFSSLLQSSGGDFGAIAATEAQDTAAFAGSTINPVAAVARATLVVEPEIRVLQVAPEIRSLRASDMAFAGDFKPKFVAGTSEVFSLDFAKVLDTGDAISSVTSSISVHYGADPDAASWLSGSAYFSGTVVSQRLSGLVGGVVYDLIFTVSTANGNTIIKFGRVTCVAVSGVTAAESAALNAVVNLESLVATLGQLPTPQLVAFAQAVTVAKENSSKTTIVVFCSSGGLAGSGATPSAANNWAPPTGNWSGLLAAALAPSGWTVYNRSISGTSTAQSIARFWTDVAPHMPSHVILATGIANDGYNIHGYFSGVLEIIRLCKLIGAVPVIRSVYPHNAMTASQYAAVLGLNRQLAGLGYPFIDQMSIFDDGAGHFIGGTTYTSDGQHLGDPGNAAMFSQIDLGIFTSFTGGQWITPKKAGAWQMSISDLSEVGIWARPTTEGLGANIRSFTLRARVKSQSGVPGTRGVMGVTFPAYNLRLRHTGPYNLADSVGSLVTSSISPQSDFSVHDLAMTYNHITDTAALYADGALIGSGTANGVEDVITALSFGSPVGAGLCASGLTFADIGAWQTPLSAREIAAMYLSGYLPRSSMILDADLSTPPNGTLDAYTGVCPNAICNGMLPVIGGSWLPVAAI